MKARGDRPSSAMRVLSARMAPPRRFEAGSTASTAIRRPRAMPARPKRSIKVDFPAPGGPEMPMRIAAARLWQDCRHQRLGFGAMVGPRRFDEGDGAGECPPVAALQFLQQGLRRGHSPLAGKYDPSRRCRRTHSIGSRRQDLVDQAHQVLRIRNGFKQMMPPALLQALGMAVIAGRQDHAASLLVSDLAKCDAVLIAGLGHVDDHNVIIVFVERVLHGRAARYQ